MRSGANEDRYSCRWRPFSQIHNPLGYKRRLGTTIRVLKHMNVYRRFAIGATCCLSSGVTDLTPGGIISLRKDFRKNSVHPTYDLIRGAKITPKLERCQL